MLTLPAGLLHQNLEALLDGGQVGSVTFQPVFDVTRGAGGTIRRMLNFLFTELEHPDSLLTNELAIQSYEERLALCLLLGLPHSHSERFLHQRASTGPANVKRAEEFMRANAREPLTIEAIANAAGCSVRAPQLVFRRFRGTTRRTELQRIRLEAALQRCYASSERSRWRGLPPSTGSAIRAGSHSCSAAFTATRPGRGAACAS
jgi:AraC-like DNA-binding protein